MYIEYMRRRGAAGAGDKNENAKIHSKDSSKIHELP